MICLTKPTEASLKNSLREYYLDKIVKYFQDSTDEEILRTGSGEIALPCVDADGNERYVQIKVVIPNGSRDGDSFDGYALAEEYKLKQESKARSREKKEKEAQKRKAVAAAKKAKKEREEM